MPRPQQTEGCSTTRRAAREPSSRPASQALATARAEAQDLMAKAKVVSQKEREQLLAKTREEQEQLLERARREIEAEKEKAILALRREAVDLSIAAASKLVESNLDSDANRRLVLEYLASLEQRH